jgi:hypothetical protein
LNAALAIAILHLISQVHLPSFVKMLHLTNKKILIKIPTCFCRIRPLLTFEIIFVTATNDLLVPAFEYSDLLASKNTVSTWNHPNIILKRVVKIDD